MIMHKKTSISEHQDKKNSKALHNLVLHNSLNYHSVSGAMGSLTWLKPAPVSICDHARGVTLAHPLIFSSVLDVLQTYPEILRVFADVFCKKAVDEGLLKPKKKKKFE